MKEIKELERQLRSWAPRRPSAGLEWRIFHRSLEPRPSAPAPRPSFRLAWLAPSTLGLLLLCALFNQRNGPQLSASGSSAPLVTLAMSNQNAAPWLPGSFSREQNGLPVETFEWTISSGSTSSISSLSAPRGEY